MTCNLYTRRSFQSILRGEFIEQSFHFIKILIESVYARFEASRSEAQLLTSRPPGTQSLVGSDIHRQSPCLKQGPKRRLWLFTLQHSTDRLLVIVQAGGMDARVHVAVVHSGFERSFPFREPGMDH